jgi:hypothetical protein
MSSRSHFNSCHPPRYCVTDVYKICTGELNLCLSKWGGAYSVLQKLAEQKWVVVQWLGCHTNQYYCDECWLELVHTLSLSFSLCVSLPGFNGDHMTQKLCNCSTQTAFFNVTSAWGKINLKIDASYKWDFIYSLLKSLVWLIYAWGLYSCKYWIHLNM